MTALIPYVLDLQDARDTCHRGARDAEANAELVREDRRTNRVFATIGTAFGGGLMWFGASSSVLLLCVGAFVFVGALSFLAWHSHVTRKDLLHLHGEATQYAIAANELDSAIRRGGPT